MIYHILLFKNQVAVEHTCNSNMAATASNVYQFKIILKGYRPYIWRRIQVPKEYSFWDLHNAIQDAMGWQKCHWHQFDMVNPKTGEIVGIGLLDESGYLKTIHGKTVKIADYFLSPKDNAIYEYDSGDGWEHDVVLEKILPESPGTQYPRCVEGKLACPPENCGGVGGYRNLRKIMANPQDEEYAGYLEWLGGHFDPISFDPKSVVFEN